MSDACLSGKLLVVHGGWRAIIGLRTWADPQNAQLIYDAAAISSTPTHFESTASVVLRLLPS